MRSPSCALRDAYLRNGPCPERLVPRGAVGAAAFKVNGPESALPRVSLRR